MQKKFTLLFGLKVEDLEKSIKLETKRITDKALTDVGLAIKQGVLSIALILKEIIADFNLVKELVKKRLAPEIEKLNEEIAQTKFEELKNDTKEKVSLNEKKIGSLEVDIKRTKLSYNWRGYKYIILAIFAFCSIDTLANFSSLQTIVDNLLWATLISICIAIGLAKGTHEIGLRIRFAESKKAKAIWAICTLIFAGLIFFFLGLQRQEFTKDQGIGAFNSPMLWALFCLFFFSLALLISIFKLPTKEQVLARNEMKSKEEEILRYMKENEAMLKTLAKVEHSYNEAKQKLEVFKKYQENLLAGIDKEVELLHSTCEKEYELKNGKILLTKSITNEY